ncbi:MAG: hypothetical protein K2Q33_00575 [Gammaproteobacteria bacterium]|nr:hypothetical protein [Gammaproteobacteria bacterium]
MIIAKKGGAKLSRSETVTVRLDPKLRYLADLAARHHRRTLSSFIEWAIEDVLKRTYIGSECNSPSLYDSAKMLWDVQEADRFFLLVKYQPELLTHDEQVLLKFTQEYYIYSQFYKERIDFQDTSFVKNCWEEIKGFLKGTISEVELKGKMEKEYIPF